MFLSLQIHELSRGIKGDSILCGASLLVRTTRSAIVALLFVGLINYFVPSSHAEASPKLAIKAPVAHNIEFITPRKLRARVDFWKDVFAKHTKYQIEIHHKDFPQVRFATVDLRKEGQTLGDIAYDTLKKRRVEDALDEIKVIFTALATGREPRTARERFIAEKMIIVPGGTSKYKQALENDLIRSQTGMREKFAEAIKRSGRYLPIIQKIFVEDFGLPKELTMVPLVESSFDYEAYSRTGAAGIWQFMPATAKQYSMLVNSVLDERRDPLESTTAAAKYFRHAYNRLGTWPLALVSYHHGVSGVLKKVRAEGSTDIASMIERPFDKRPFGFASSNYYPSLLAAIEVYDERATIYPDVRPEPALQLTKVRLPSRAHVNEVAKRLGVSISTLRLANYALSESVWTGRSPIPAGYVLKIPQRYDARVQEIASLPKTSEPTAKVASKPSAKAKSPTVKAGKKATEIARSPGRKSSSPVTTVYKAKSGDSLWSIARQHKVNLNTLIKLNPKYKKGIKPGQVVVLPK